MIEEIIIDGVNVAKCQYFNKVFNEEPYCNIDEEHLYTCSSEPNCYFKQLQRLKKENEKLKNINNDLIEEIASGNIDIAILQKENKELKEKIKSEKYIKENALQEATKYSMKCGEFRQALEEINKTILNYESKEWNCFNNMDAKLEKISEILDEVLNDN